jgi:ribosomal protein S18 acetylase RimI-like enzyme
MSQCEVCGFEEWAELRWSSRRHLIAHDEFLHGVRVRASHSYEVVRSGVEYSILLVRPSSPLWQRMRAERVSRRSIREPLWEGGYDKPTYYAEPEPEEMLLFPHTLLLCRGKRAVGILVLEARPIRSFLRWSGEVELVEETVSTGEIRWTVTHAWVLPTLRQRGFATALVHTAAAGVATNIGSLGWMPPFTTAGLRLVRRVAPDGAFVASHAIPNHLDGINAPFE